MRVLHISKLRLGQIQPTINDMILFMVRVPPKGDVSRPATPLCRTKGPRFVALACASQLAAINMSAVSDDRRQQHDKKAKPEV